MPSIQELNSGITNYGLAWFDGRYYYVVDPGGGKGYIFDVYTLTFKTFTFTPIGTNPKLPGILRKAARTSTGAMLEGVHFGTNQINRVRYYVDVSAGSVTTETVYSNSVSQVLTNETWNLGLYGDLMVGGFYGYSDIYYFDTYTGSYVKTVTGPIAGYFVRCDKVFSVRGDDIYILLGVHYAGESFRKLKAYAGTYTVITNGTVGGDSPDTQATSIVMFKDKTLFTATGSSVVNSQPPILWLNENLDVVGSTSLTSIYTYAREYGFWVVGRTSTQYVALAVLWNNTWNYETARAAYLLYIDPTNFSIANYTKLTDFAVRRTFVAGSQNSKWQHMPVVDRNKKKVYIEGLGAWGDNANVMYVVDLSDVPIVEWNEAQYFVGEARKPTALQLTVTPL
jgi:hypothetical protein